MPENRVNFFVVGAQRCGTTFLCDALSDLDTVNFSSPKEPCFFTQTDDWHDEIEVYHNHFQFGDGTLNGEGSTHYTMVPKYRPVHERLHEYNPHAKIIYSMRNPVDRAVSLFTYYRGGQASETRFKEAVDQNIEYLCAGMYYRQIAPYIDLFGRSNVHLILFEDFVSQPPTVLRRVAEFLGVPTSPRDFRDGEENTSEGNYAPASDLSETLYKLYGRSGIHQFVPEKVIEIGKKYLLRTSEKPTLSTDLRRRLSGFFLEDVRHIEDLLGRKLNEWRFSE